MTPGIDRERIMSWTRPKSSVTFWLVRGIAMLTMRSPDSPKQGRRTSVAEIAKSGTRGLHGADCSAH